MPTGGVDASNAASYLRAGAVTVAVGGRLVDPADVARCDWSALTRRARDMMVAVDGCARC